MPLAQLQKNAAAQPGDVLFLTKPLGVGIVTTTQKRGTVDPDHLAAAVESMQTLNAIGADLAAMPGVHAMTDVTGFGLMGHLLEMCQGSDTQAEVYGDQVQTFEGVPTYHAQGMVPGGARRNHASYGAHLDLPEGYLRDLLCDPQTSGGLLVAVAPEHAEGVSSLLAQRGMPSTPVGRMLGEGEVLEGGVTVAYRPIS